MQRRSNDPRLKPLDYVEGIAVGPIVDPMLHAWNFFHDGRGMMDWTFYAGAHWTYYLGVAVSYEEYRALCACVYPGCQVMSIFSADTYSIKIRIALWKILQRRKRTGKRLPLKRGRH